MLPDNYIEKRVKKLLTHKLKKPYQINFGGYRFLVFPNVFDPQLATSSKILLNNIKIQKGARVLDIGCGTGIQGIVSFYKGASKITFADNNPHAIKNTKENLKIHSLCKNIEVIKSDLFKNIKGKFDTILFNSPFIYTKKPIKKDWIIKSIFDYKYQKIRRFFRDSKKHLNTNGYILFVFCEAIDSCDMLNSIFVENNFKKKTIFSEKIGVENWVVYKLFR